MPLNRKQWLLIAAGGLVILVAAVPLYFYLTRDQRPLSFTDTVRGGTGSEVRITRNGNGVPLITADSYEDAYFALGFIHAQDRFKLMDYYRSIANGWSRTMVGSDGPILNRLSAIIGFTRTAASLAARIPAPYDRYLARYAAGINRGRIAAQYQNTIGRDWTAEDVLTILVMKEWANAFLNNKENVFQLPRGKRDARFKDIIPEDLLSYFGENEEQCVSVVKRLRQIVRRHLGTFGRGYAFAVPSMPLQNQQPFLAYSMDDELSLYPGWYPVHLEVEGRRLRGVTFAGMPFFFAGTNGSLSYASHNLGMDTQDFMYEQITRSGKDVYYLGPEGWREFASARVPLTVSGGKIKNHLVWSTGNGPLLNDAFPGEEYHAGVVTLKHYQPAEDYIIALFTMPQAETYAQAQARLKGIHSYPRAWVIAADADAKTFYTGFVPQRDRDDQVFRPGTRDPWKGLVDLSREGKKPWGGSFIDDEALGDLRAALNHDRERQQRLVYLLDGRTRVTEQDIENTLHDRYSMPAERYMPILMDLLKDNPVTSSRLARIFFQNWNKEMNADQVAPLLYQLLLQRFIYETLSDELGNATADVMEHYQYLIPKFYDLVAANQSDLFDDASTYQRENRAMIFDRAFLKTMRLYSRKSGPYMEQWKWGAVHHGRFRIPWRRPGFFTKEPDDIAYHGSFSTLMKGAFNLNLKPVEITSLSGYFGTDASLLYLRFAQSITRRAPFSYANVKGTSLVNFQDIDPRYRMAITPEKPTK